MDNRFSRSRRSDGHHVQAKSSPCPSVERDHGGHQSATLSRMMRIAISTGGGDAPGLNAVIRSAVLSALNRGWEVLGITRGSAGLLGEDEVVIMTRDSVRGIAHLGGTILRTTSRGNPFNYPVRQQDGSSRMVDRSDELIENTKQLGIDAMITIGGDGSLGIAKQLCDKGLNIVGVPKTI